MCSSCALFGGHKGHDIRMEDDIAKEISLKVEVLMEMFAAMDSTLEELNDLSRHKNLMN